MSIKPSALSRNRYEETPSYGDIDIRNTFTGRGFCGLSPWNNAGYKYSMLQLDLGYNPISNLEVVSMININNISRGWIYYDLADRPKKYNPKVYIGSPTSLGNYWNQDTQNISQKPNSKGPERYQQSINASLTTSDNTDKI